MSEAQQSPSGAQPFAGGAVDILPPAAPAAGARTGGRKPRPHWAVAPATYALGAINIAVWLAMVATGTSPVTPRSAQLIAWGADFGPFVLVYGQWWRLLSAAFVHIGIVHLVLNMWCLWNLGLLGEPLLGAVGMLAVYLLAGVGGNLLSVAVNPGLANPQMAAIGAGASGAIFGIAGALIVLLKSKRLPLPEAELRALRRNVIWFAVLNFVLGAGSSFSHSSIQVDNMAHLGGFVVGLAMAAPMVPRIGSSRALFRQRRGVAIALVSVGLALGAYGVYSFYAPALAALR